jgi:twinkle protein
MSIIGNTACPGCVKKGRDKTGNHLMLFEDGGAYCNRCGYKEDTNTFTPVSQNLRGVKTDEEIFKEIQWIQDNSVIAGIKERQLKHFACDFYGVRTGYSLEDGITPLVTYFPIHEETTLKLTGYKCKSVNKKMWSKGRGTDAAFFGADVVPRNGNKLFITEGQDDAVALYQTIYEKVDQQFKRRVAVVSLQNGANSAAAEMVRNKELISGYKEIVLCFDMDDAGRNAVSSALSVLPRDKVTVAKYQLKDCNDMVKSGLATELYFNVIKAQPACPEKIVSGGDISFEEMRTPLKKGLTTPYPGINSKMRGLRYGQGAGELSIICAAPGFGKTTLTRELNYDILANHQLRVGNIFLEENKVKTANGLVAIDNNVSLAALREDPTIITDEAAKASYDKLVNTDRYFALNHWGSLQNELLMDHMWYFSKALHANFIFLDHISLVISGQDSSSAGERKDLDVLMTKLAAFTAESGTSIIAVVHLKRPENGSFNEGKQISLNHLRGSSAIEGLAHNIVAIEGDQQGENANARTLRILKSREWGDIGVCDNLMYNPDTGRLLPDVGVGSNIGGMRGVC